MATTIPDTHRDLLETDTAVLATVGPDGRPQLSAVWFLAGDDGKLRVSLNSTRQKGKNLQANPAVNLFILDRANPQRYLEVRGDATIEDDADRAFAQQVGAKYDADLKAYDPPGATRLVVTIDPVRVNAVDIAA